MSNESRDAGDDEGVPGFGAADSADDTPAEPVLVPPEELPAELLRAVIEAFVLREGTEYGEREYTLDEKVAHVEQQLRKGDARIVYDPNTQSVDIRRR
jgi:uncharacterized protein YheU (UPF0270 family)